MARAAVRENPLTEVVVPENLPLAVEQEGGRPVEERAVEDQPAEVVEKVV